jgi:hypothetical protein
MVILTVHILFDYSTLCLVSLGRDGIHFLCQAARTASAKIQSKSTTECSKR